MLSRVESKIYLSFALWTSANGFIICRIIAHIVIQHCESYRCQALLLAPKRMARTHTAENTAEIFWLLTVIPALLRRNGVVVVVHQQ